MKNHLQRIAGWALCLLLLGSFCPSLSEETGSVSEIQAGDLVYFGTADEVIGFDGAWRVLDAEQTNTGEAGMFLLSENLIGRDTRNGLYFRNEKEPTTNAYAGSDAKAWCADFFATHFSEAEQAAILPTYKSDAAIAIPSTLFNDVGEHQAVVRFDAAENILDGDRVFLLSAEEASNPAYGFDSDESRIARFGKTAANWWLRSPHDPSFPIDVGLVFYSGWLMDFFENWDNAFFTAPICMRPALNLDTDRIVSVERVGEGEWRLTFADETEAPKSYAYGVRTEIRQPVLASMLLWIVLGAVVLIHAGIVLLIVLSVRRKRRKTK
ncbi:MAG: hypothetical protein IJK01_01345 [Clostridia bacterium]|nr:hypothetical protein [Clostridia bacterium]